MYAGVDGLLVEVQDKILVIKFNKPERKNCVNGIIYKEIGRLLRQVAKDPKITMVVFTGVGDFYTAGNDLKQQDMAGEDLENFTFNTFKEFIASFIDCPKIVVSLVNGPCIGIGVTLAGLSDLVWCSNNAYFKTPFTSLGIVPEGCSTYLFPLILGRSKATELLILNESMSAQEALQFNFVSRIFKLSDLKTKIWPKLREYSNLPKGSVEVSKDLIRRVDRETLYKVLDDECKALYERFFTEEFVDALVAFSSRKKSKL